MRLFLPLAPLLLMACQPVHMESVVSPSVSFSGPYLKKSLADQMRTEGRILYCGDTDTNGPDAFSIHAGEIVANSPEDDVTDLTVVKEADHVFLQDAKNEWREAYVASSEDEVAAVKLAQQACLDRALKSLNADSEADSENKAVLIRKQLVIALDAREPSWLAALAALATAGGIEAYYKTRDNTLARIENDVAKRIRPEAFAIHELENESKRLASEGASDDAARARSEKHERVQKLRPELEKHNQVVASRKRLKVTARTASLGALATAVIAGGVWISEKHAQASLVREIEQRQWGEMMVMSDADFRAYLRMHPEERDALIEFHKTL